jgi:flagellar biogenesis protein FliO
MLTFKQWCWTVLRFSGALAIVGVAVWGWKKIARSRKP